MNRKTYTLDITLASAGDLPIDAEAVDLVRDQMSGELDPDGLECVAVLLKSVHTPSGKTYDNADRADGALAALEPYAYKGGLTTEYHAAAGNTPDASDDEQRECFMTVAGDLLADLFHAAKRHRIAPFDLYDRALGHFEMEVEAELVEDDE